MSDISKASLPKAIFLMGPTASGKTALAIELRKILPVELISVDSALIYKGMDIGTAKPNAEELLAAPHRLLDIRDPSQAYSAADFRRDALAEMALVFLRLFEQRRIQQRRDLRQVQAKIDGELAFAFRVVLAALYVDDFHRAIIAAAAKHARLFLETGGLQRRGKRQFDDGVDAFTDGEHGKVQAGQR